VKSKKGALVVRQATAKDRLARAIKAINLQCREMMHWQLQDQQEILNRKLRGHYAYFGITGNFKKMSQLYHETKRRWRKWLSRRTRGGSINWDTFNRLLKRMPIMRPKIVHDYA
jgi:hypothetical protein